MSPVAPGREQRRTRRRRRRPGRPRAAGGWCAAVARRARSAGHGAERGGAHGAGARRCARRRARRCARRAARRSTAAAEASAVVAGTPDDVGSCGTPPTVTGRHSFSVTPGSGMSPASASDEALGCDFGVVLGVLGAAAAGLATGVAACLAAERLVPPAAAVVETRAGTNFVSTPTVRCTTTVRCGAGLTAAIGTGACCFCCAGFEAVAIAASAPSAARVPTAAIFVRGALRGISSSAPRGRGRTSPGILSAVGPAFRRLVTPFFRGWTFLRVRPATPAPAGRREPAAGAAP